MTKTKDLFGRGYVSPEVEITEILVESCFAISNSTIEDMTEEELDW